MRQVHFETEIATILPDDPESVTRTAAHCNKSTTTTLTALAAPTSTTAVATSESTATTATTAPNALQPAPSPPATAKDAIAASTITTEEQSRPQSNQRPQNWLSNLLSSDWPLSTPPHHNIHTSSFDMPSLNGFAASSGGPEQTNGTTAQVNGEALTHRPKTPPPNSAMALTEYSVCPSPPSETAQKRIRETVPSEFLLPDGYPDVCFYSFFFWRGGGGGGIFFS